jgi:Ni/Fe-hydrogenase 1 B-type cytochrome subunit
MVNQTTDMIGRTARSKMNFRTMQRVYVFQIPTRAFHWINVLCLVALSITGYLIGDPPAIQHSTEAYTLNWFGINRYIHFTTAWIFTINWAFRIIWGFFLGNRWETWDNFIPTTKAKWREMRHVLQQDILLAQNKQHVSIGHNALAGFSYFMLLLCVVLTIVTGFGLYIGISESWVVTFLGWPSRWMGNEMFVRFIHHILMWIFVLFTIVHVYLVFFHDYVEGRGETSSMISGWKFIEERLWKRYIKKQR